MRVLGISAFYHDSAAALVEDGRVIAAAQEERFTRKKFDANYPRHAIDYCLNHERLKLKDIDYVSFYDKPFLKFERLLETYLAFSPRGFASFRMALPLWLREKLFLKSLLADELKALEPDYDWEKRLVFPEHHLSHAASAFYPSPFEHAAVLTMDGVGEWATTSAAVGHGQNLAIHKEIHFPHSLGLLYAGVAPLARHSLLITSMPHARGPSPIPRTAWRVPIWVQNSTRRTSRLDLLRQAPASRPCRARQCLTPPRGLSRTVRGSAGSRAAWSSVRARSATVRSWVIRAIRRCRRISISR
jgi:hypothetical protein